MVKTRDKVYDAAGNVISTTELANVPGLARTTRYQYDAVNRPVTVTTNYINGVFDPLRPDEEIASNTG